jgi:hypothetical protein
MGWEWQPTLMYAISARFFTCAAAAMCHALCCMLYMLHMICAISPNGAVASPSEFDSIVLCEDHTRRSIITQFASFLGRCENEDRVVKGCGSRLPSLICKYTLQPHAPHTPGHLIGMYPTATRFLQSVRGHGQWCGGHTRPHACPSGVSAGQMMPHCVLCSCRGFASLPSRPTGELMRRRCDRVDAYASLFSTCAQEHHRVLETAVETYA